MSWRWLSRVPLAILVCISIGLITKGAVNLIDRLYGGAVPAGVPVVIWIAAALSMLGVAALILFGKRGSWGSENTPVDE